MENGPGGVENATPQAVEALFLLLLHAFRVWKVRPGGAGYAWLMELQAVELIERIAGELGLDATGDPIRDLASILRRVEGRMAKGRTGMVGPAGAPLRRGQKGWPEELREDFMLRLRIALQARTRGDLHELADFLGVKWDNVYRMAKGTVVPSTPQIVRLADFLQVSTDWLLGRRKDPNG